MTREPIDIGHHPWIAEVDPSIDPSHSNDRPVPSRRSTPSIRPSTSAIALIDTVDPSIDRCHRDDRHHRSNDRPVPSRPSTTSIKRSTPVIRTIDAVMERVVRNLDCGGASHRSHRGGASLRLRSRLRLDSPGAAASPPQSRKRLDLISAKACPSRERGGPRIGILRSSGG